MGVATRPFFLSPEGEVILTGRDGGMSQVHVTTNCSSEPLSLDPSMSSTIRSLATRGATPPDEVLLVTEREETLDDDEMVSSLADLVKISVFISEPSPRSL